MYLKSKDRYSSSFNCLMKQRYRLGEPNNEQAYIVFIIFQVLLILVAIILRFVCQPSYLASFNISNCILHRSEYITTSRINVILQKIIFFIRNVPYLNSQNNFFFFFKSINCINDEESL